MSFKKILGLVLLFFGLILICWILYASYNIFTGKTEAPELFSEPKEETVLQPEQMAEEQTMEAQLREALPIDPNALPKTLNLTAWGILAFILIFGGSQIAGLGVKLLK